MRELSNQTVGITGASSDIGRAAFLALAREGARAVLLARWSDALKRAADGCGLPPLAVPIDVTDPDAVRRMAGNRSDGRTV